MKADDSDYIKIIFCLLTTYDLLSHQAVTVKPEKNRLILTLKKSLVETSLPILTEYDQAAIGMLVEGTVIEIIKAGIRVAFYNNVVVSYCIIRKILWAEIAGSLKKHYLPENLKIFSLLFDQLKAVRICNGFVQMMMFFFCLGSGSHIWVE